MGAQYTLVANMGAYFHEHDVAVWRQTCCMLRRFAQHHGFQISDSAHHLAATSSYSILDTVISGDSFVVWCPGQEGRITVAKNLSRLCVRAYTHWAVACIVHGIAVCLGSLFPDRFSSFLDVGILDPSWSSTPICNPLKFWSSGAVGQTFASPAPGVLGHAFGGELSRIRHHKQILSMRLMLLAVLAGRHDLVVNGGTRLCYDVVGLIRDALYQIPSDRLPCACTFMISRVGLACIASVNRC